MDTEIAAKIAAFVKERDEMLLANNIDRMMAFHIKHHPSGPSFSNREVAEISLHKARTGARSLPLAPRIESFKWLKSRGYSSLDDGELAHHAKGAN